MAATQIKAWSEVTIAPEFGVVSGFFKKLSHEIEDTTKTSTSSKTGSKAGQISLLRYEPAQLTHKQKIAKILKKIDDGELVIAPGKTATDIVTELSKPEHEGKSIKTLIAELKNNNEFLVDELKLKHPAPAFARAFRPSVPALALG